MPDQSLKTRIVTPVISMLKTSSTKSAEPPKGVVGVGGSRRNKAESVGKHEIDKVNDDGGCSSDFDKKFHPRLQYGSRGTHLDIQDQLISRLNI